MVSDMHIYGEIDFLKLERSADLRRSCLVSYWIVSFGSVRVCMLILCSGLLHCRNNFFFSKGCLAFKCFENLIVQNTHPCHFE